MPRQTSRGQTLSEWAIGIGIVALVALVGLAIMSGALGMVFRDISSRISAAAGPAATSGPVASGLPGGSPGPTPGPVVGALGFPGHDESHGGWANTLGSITAGGTGFLVVDITAIGSGFNGSAWDLVDDAGTSSSSALPGTSGFTPGPLSAAVGVWYRPIPHAGSWHIVTNQGHLADPSIAGAATWAIHYPGTPNGPLSFPGTTAGNVQNTLASFAAGPTIVFLTLSSALPGGWDLGIAQAGFGDDHYVRRDIAAGTYVFYLSSGGTWHPYAYSHGSYDGSLTGSGVYEAVTLPPGSSP